MAKEAPAVAATDKREEAERAKAARAKEAPEEDPSPSASLSVSLCTSSLSGPLPHQSGLRGILPGLERGVPALPQADCT